MIDVKKRQSIKWDNGTVDPRRKLEDDGVRPKWQKWHDSFDFGRRSSKALTAHPPPLLSNAINP